MSFIFDGSYAGLLSVVFHCFETKVFQGKVYTRENFIGNMFEEVITIENNSESFNRVQKGLINRLGQNKANDLFKACLSEDSEVFQSVYNIIMRLFKGENNILSNYGDADVMKVSKTLKSISRERHRMKAFIRFSKANDGLYYALVDPDFNVLPLIISFFRNRYADQKWLIYDTKRNYGIYYDLRTVTEVKLMESEMNALSKSDSIIEIDEQEAKYQKLWQQYFKSTNIEARKNTKLHLQHVPKRYWKYLTEKQTAS